MCYAHFSSYTVKFMALKIGHATLFILEPDDAPTNITLVGVDSTSLLAGWQLPTTPNGIVTHYTLYINYTNGSKIFIKVVESQFSLYLIEGLSPYQLVGVSISATTMGGEGPLSSTVYNTTHETGLLLIYFVFILQKY